MIRSRDLILKQVGPQLLRQLLLVDKEGVWQLLFLLQQAVQQSLKLLWCHIMRQIQLRPCIQMKSC